MTKVASATVKSQPSHHGPQPVMTARFALAAALIAIVLTGIRAAVPVADWNDGRWHGHGIPLALGLELVLIALLTALGRRDRREPTGQLAARLRAQIRVVLIMGMVIIPVLVIINATSAVPLHLPRLLTPLANSGNSTQRPTAPLTVSWHGSLVPVLYAVIVVALVAAIVLLAMVVAGQTRPTREGYGELTDDEELLRRAVRSGQAALRDISDAQRAIIACYVAMEHSMAMAGTVRGEAETPDELLSRAAAAGLTHGPEAGQLTALFYEARFSSHPMPPARRQEALRALAVLAADQSGTGQLPHTGQPAAARAGEERR